MSEFKVIETQEELDNIIKDRLARNTKTVTDAITEQVKNQYEGFISPDEQEKLTKKITELTKQLGEKDTSIADLTASNKAYETASVKARIAREYNIPYELADKLSGETEEDIKADAEIFSKFVGMGENRQPAPLFNAEVSSDKLNSAYSGLLNGLMNND